MKNKFIKQALISLSVCTLMACSEESVDDATVPSLVEQNVVLSSGINFDNGETVVFNPLTGEIIKPCKENAANAKKYDKQGQQECKINESDIVAPAPVLDAIKNSREIIKGYIKKDGKEIPARFSISVSVIYEGSMCITYWSGGNEYPENCTTVKQKCNYYVPSFRHRFIDANVTKTCKNFPGWPDRKIPLP